MQGFSNFSLAQSYHSLNNVELTEKHLINALDIFIDIGDVTNQGPFTCYYTVSFSNHLHTKKPKPIWKKRQNFKENDNKGPTYNTYSLYANFI